MAEETGKDPSIDDFGNPYYRYRGEVTPQNLVFDANLQEFAYRVTTICNLENAGKIPPQKAYEQIRELWSELELSKKNLLDNPQGDDPS